IEIDRPLPQAEGHAAQIGLRRIAIKHVDLAGLQSGEPVLRGERDVAYLARVTENSGCQRAAIVDVKALVIALGVRSGESGKAGTDAAYERAAMLDGVQCSSGCRRKPFTSSCCNNGHYCHSPE